MWTSYVNIQICSSLSSTELSKSEQYDIMVSAAFTIENYYKHISISKLTVVLLNVYLVY